MEEKWNWSEMKNPYWMTPADSSYYFASEWKIKNYLKVIDVGAGIGRHSLLFAKNGFDVIAFDNSESGLTLLSESARSQNLYIETILGDMSKMPLENESCDAVFAYHTIYHTEQESLTVIISELFRILKPSGEAFITMLAKEDEHYIMNMNNRISPNVVLKKDGNSPLVPHYYIDHSELEELFSMFDFISCKKVVEYIQQHQLCHYHLHLSKPLAGGR